MSKDIKFGSDTFNGVSQLVVNTTDGGTATFKDVDDIQPVEVSDIPSEQTIVGTAEQEMTFNEFFNTHPLDCSRDGIYLINIYGENAPTQGNRTVFRIVIAFDQRVPSPYLCAAGFSQSFGTNKLVAPNSAHTSEGINMMTTAYAISGSYITRNNITGNLNIHANFNTGYMPEGAIVKYTYLPIDLFTLTKK